MSPVYSYLATTNTGLQYQPVSAFSVAAPLLHDGSIGDTATGYNSATSGSGRCELFALIDLGAAAPTVAQYEIAALSTVSASETYTYTLYCSQDGTNWTQQAAVSASGTTVTNSGKVALANQTTGIQYWQMALISGSSTAITLSMTDLRLYNASGTEIGTSPSVNHSRLLRSVFLD